MEAPPPKVQHVPKVSSDQLLRKFAEIDSGSDAEPARESTSKRRRMGKKKSKKKDVGSNKGDDHGEEDLISPSKEDNIVASGSFRGVERRSLLPRQRSRRSSGALIRQLGISRSHLRGCRDFKHKFVLGAIEKTWSKAVKGASRVFMEKHYNRHRMLINDLA